MVLARRILVVGAALTLSWTGSAASAPAQAEVGGYTSWQAHDSAAGTADDATDSWSGTDVHLGVHLGGVSVWTETVDGHRISAGFTAPAGATLAAGATYRTQSWPEIPTARAGRLTVYRDGLMCGKDFDHIEAADVATGSFTVQELERDADGAVTRFRATYELDCQTLGGPRGAEGSVAVNAAAPAEVVPGAVSPGPVSGLRATNVGPDGSGNSTTTLSWTNPVGGRDVVIDMVQSTGAAKLPAAVGRTDTLQYRGPASSYRDGHVEFMESRTWRVVPRGANGRLGEPSYLTVSGSRLSIPDITQRIQVGQDALFSGRLSQSWDYVDPADVMKGPALVGQEVVLCRQSSVHYVDGSCEPVARTTTTSGGRFTLVMRPVQNSYYNVMVPAGPEIVGNVSRLVSTTLVSPQTDLAAPEAAPAAARATSVRRGSVIHFSTSRARFGSRGTASLQRLDGRTWRTVLTRRLPTRGASRMAMPFRERTPGQHLYRVVKPADGRHVQGSSKVVRVSVR